MIENIKVDVPQFVVLPHLSYSGISKQFIDRIGQYFLWSYLGEKFSDYSVRHHIMNEQIIEIYLIHTEQVENRIRGEMYSMDEKHYTQLFFTQQVCKNIASIVAELCYCIYFMKYLQTEEQMPDKIEITQAYNLIMQNAELKDQLKWFSAFIAQTEDVRHSYNVNIIRPGYDYFMTETEPVYFVTDKDGTLTKYLLKKFIEQYNSFFLVCKHILRHHSPDAIGHSLEKWKE